MFELGLFLVLFAARNLAEVAIVPRFLDRRRPSLGSGLSSLLLMGGAYLSSALAVTWWLYRAPSPPLLLYGSGLLCMASGYIGRLVCLRQLGEAYSQSFAAHPGRLVTTGLYSVIRHPIYTFFLLELAAFLLIRANAVSAVTLGLVALCSAYRIRREEQQLLATFGESYRAYRQQTRAVLPFIL